MVKWRVDKRDVSKAGKREGRLRRLDGHDLRQRPMLRVTSRRVVLEQEGTHPPC